MKKIKNILFGDELVLGVDVVDQQHKRLIKCFNSIIDANVSNRGDLPNLFSEFASYTEFHLKNEVEFMYQIKFPDIDRHVNKHDAILAEIHRVASSYNYDDGINLDELDNLKDLFVYHIMVEDLKYVEYYNNKNKNA